MLSPDQFPEFAKKPSQNHVDGADPREDEPPVDSFDAFGARRPDDEPERNSAKDKGQKSPLPKSLPFKTLADFAAEETVQKKWLIKGIFARGETSAWVGPPGSMKSSVLCSAAIHASSTEVTDWFGYRCKEKTASLYFALERSDLVKRRLIAECRTLEIDFPPIAIIQKQFTLARPGEHRLLADTIKAAEDQFGMPVGIATFDTLAKLIAAGGGDENSARDCNMVFANITELKNETNVHVAFAAHTGKEVSRGTRGSNAQPGDFDVEIIISGETIRTATVTKRNDGAEGPLFSFGSRMYVFGKDEDGDPIDINIAVGTTEPSEKSKQHRGLSAKDRLALAAMDEVTLTEGKPAPPAMQLPGTVRVAPLESWRAELLARGVVDRESKNPRTDFSRIKIKLTDLGLVGERDGLVWKVTKDERN
jgi:hypothetical protein